MIKWRRISLQVPLTFQSAPAGGGRHALLLLPSEEERQFNCSSPTGLLVKLPQNQRAPDDVTFKHTYKYPPIDNKRALLTTATVSRRQYSGFYVFVLSDRPSDPDRTGGFKLVLLCFPANASWLTCARTNTWTFAVSCFAFIPSLNRSVTVAQEM